MNSLGEYAAPTATSGVCQYPAPGQLVHCSDRVRRCPRSRAAESVGTVMDASGGIIYRGALRSSARLGCEVGSHRVDVGCGDTGLLEESVQAHSDALQDAWHSAARGMLANRWAESAAVRIRSKQGQEVPSRTNRGELHPTG